MKKNLPVTAMAVMLICIMMSCSHHARYHNDNVSIMFSESENTYRLKAKYDEDKTGRVQRYINAQIEPNGLFASSEDYFDANTELGDKTRFYIKSSPGRLEIKLNKQQNSYASYKRIKHMCEGIAGVLKEQ